MNDVAEFLLARIAEDEERATFVQAQQAGQKWPPFEPWRLSWQDEYDLLCIEPTRVLAECEAKRRIVAIMREGEWEAGWTLADRVLGSLALPYVDHPDYREEWRP